MRVNFGKETFLYPMPVLLIGTYDEECRPNLMNAAWGGIHDTNQLFLCLSSSHKTTKKDEAIVDINTNSKGDCLIEVFDKDEKIVYKKEVSIDKNYNFNLKIDGAHKWSIEDPYLYYEKND